MLFQQECLFSHLQLIPFQGSFLQGVLAHEEGRARRISLVSDPEAAAEEIQKRWPHVTVSYSQQSAFDFQEMIQTYVMAPQGTSFQIRVWQELLQIPYGQTRSYGEVAERIGCPGAGRAVGNAAAQNPLAYVIPCHRVIRHDGSLGHYRWGSSWKEKLLQEETLNKSCSCH